MFAFSVKNPAHGPVYPRQGRSVSIAHTLSWEVVGATQIQISGMGEQPATGSVTVAPNATTNYTLSAVNGAGTTTRTCTVRVAGSMVWKSDKIYGFGQLISEDVASAGGTVTTYIHSDQVGSPNWVTDASGAPAGSSKNLPFGERFVANGAQSSFRYAGHEDQPGSPVYMQARMFLPAYGRFGSPDPAYDQNAEDTQSWNLYGYCVNNPVTRVDPFGMNWVDDGLIGAYRFLGQVPVVGSAMRITAAATNQTVDDSGVHSVGDANTRLSQAGGATLGLVVDSAQVLSGGGMAATIKSVALDTAVGVAGEYAGGPHRLTKEPRGDGLDSHHMPGRHTAGLSVDDGPAIQMDQKDHWETSSNGRKPGSKKWNAEAAEMIKNGKARDAMAREVKDVRRVAREAGNGRKYNRAMIEVLEYAKKVMDLAK